MAGRPPAALAALTAVAASLASGCSLLLDWDPKPDAGLDPAACGYKEPNDTLATAVPLAPSDTGPAAICVGGDHDFYRVSVPADGLAVTLSVSFDISTSQDLDLNFYTGAGALVASGVSFGTTTETITCPGSAPSCPQLPTGEYVLEVLGSTSAVRNVYQILLLIQ